MMNMGNFVILILYVDDILLANNDESLLKETKKELSQYFDMKDLENVFFVLGIELYCDKSQGLLSLSQKSYIDKVLKRFNMASCSHSFTPIQKGEVFSKIQCPQNDDEKSRMNMVPYASIINSLMYAQVCTHPDIAFTVSVLGRCLVGT